MKCYIIANDSRTVFEHPTAVCLKDNKWYGKAWEAELTAEEVIEMAKKYSIPRERNSTYDVGGIVVSTFCDAKYDLEIIIYDDYLE